jgi:hypothetical protein
MNDRFRNISHRGAESAEKKFTVLPVQTLVFGDFDVLLKQKSLPFPEGFMYSFSEQLRDLNRA